MLADSAAASISTLREAFTTSTICGASSRHLRSISRCDTILVPTPPPLRLRIGLTGEGGAEIPRGWPAAPVASIIFPEQVIGKAEKAYFHRPSHQPRGGHSEQFRQLSPEGDAALSEGIAMMAMAFG
ncbi:hypothetical protein [Novosphingobium colocasiae]|uniref:hypothetical protein n=1 Tax=Novosphingobium colocasiae TaxID=1256513 RepID=UPI0035B0A04A